MLGLSTKLDQISANNADITAKLKETDGETNTQITKILNDMSSTSLKIEEWNSKLAAMKTDLEAKQQVSYVYQCLGLLL